MRKFAVLISFIFFCTFLFSQSAHAQVQDYSVNKPSSIQEFTPNLASDVEPNLHSLTQGLMIEILAALSCQLAGLDPLTADNRCLTIDPRTKSLAYAESVGGGAVGFMALAVGNSFNIPVSGIGYGTYMASNFGIIEPAYAQLSEGVGFSGLRPVLEVWKVFRNLVYLAFILIFMFIGLSIMLRIHLDPRTVMSIQNQLPKIIVALILITFSYAIVGLMIDFMYVLIFLAFNVAAEIYQNLGISQPEIPNIHTNPLGFVNKLYAPDVPFVGDSLGLASITYGASKTVSSLIVNLFGGLIDSVVGSLFTGILGIVIGGPLGLLAGGGAAACSIIGNIPGLSDAVGFVGGIVEKIPFGIGGAIVGGTKATCGGVEGIVRSFIGLVTGIIAFVIIMIAILVSLFRLWFTLIKAFIFLLLDVVFAPFWIALGLIPGNSLGFSAWIRDTVSNLIVFPAVIVLFLLGRVFMDGFGAVANDGQFIPPLIGNPGESNLIGSLIGLGVILMAPQLLTDIKNILKSPNPQLPAVRESLAIGRAGGGQIAGGVKERAWKRNPTTGALEGYVGERAGMMQNRVGRFFFGINQTAQADHMARKYGVDAHGLSTEDKMAAVRKKEAELREQKVGGQRKNIQTVQTKKARDDGDDDSGDRGEHIAGTPTPAHGSDTLVTHESGHEEGTPAEESSPTTIPPTTPIGRVEGREETDEESDETERPEEENGGEGTPRA